MYRAVIVGCGRRAPDYIAAYRQSNNAEIVACCDRSGQRSTVLAKKYGVHAYRDMKEMIVKEQPDIVHLITWPDTRVELMTMVSDLHVPLCTVEKPIATGVQDWKQLHALEATSTTKFAISHQLRWHKYLTKCQQAVERGHLGAIRFLDLSAGMNIAGQGTHILNYGMALNGDSPVTQVFGNASGWDLHDRGHPGPQVTEASLTFQNGVRALWMTGPLSPHCGNPETTWQHVRVAAYADHGQTFYEEFGRWEIISGDEREQGHFGGREAWRRNNVLAQATFHQAMFTWLEDDRRIPGTSLKQSLHEWSVVLALYQSVLERQPIDLPTFRPPDDLLDRLQCVLQRAENCEIRGER